jgi:hypothetical protein
MDRIFRGEPVGPEEHCFRMVAEFEAPTGRHGGLYKGIFVGIAECRRDAAMVRFHRVT